MTPQALYWKNNKLTLLDQTKLPLEAVHEEQNNIEQVWQSIYQLKVRGAPAIGVAAAYGCLTGLHEKLSLPLNEFKTLFRKQAEYLNTSRPTAVNLGRAIALMLDCMEKSNAQNATTLYEKLLAEAQRIHNEDIAICKAIGEAGLPLINDGMGILTHCNAGVVATTGIGTALAPMYLAHERGIKFKVYADETRPLLQGARLTEWELRQAGIDVCLNCDNMAADLMARGRINLVIVGCDRVAANGDTANKIGTLGVAVLASHYGIPFYVACPSSTIDFAIGDGAQIPIEMRSQDEVMGYGQCLWADKAAKTYNPAFDVTPHALITGFITEKGIIRPPYTDNLRILA